MNGEVEARIAIAAAHLADERALAAALPLTERALLTLLAGGPVHVAAADLRAAATLTDPDTIATHTHHLYETALAHLHQPTIGAHQRHHRRGAA